MLRVLGVTRTARTRSEELQVPTALDALRSTGTFEILVHSAIFIMVLDTIFWVIVFRLLL